MCGQDNACYPRPPWKPVPWEVTPWLDAAGGVRFTSTDTRPVGSLGAGIEATAKVFTPQYSDYSLPHRLTEVRAGPWLGFESPIDRSRGEAGLAFDWDGREAQMRSTFGLRAGVGYGSARVAHAVLQLSWGARYVIMRQSSRFLCPPVIALVSGVRVFVAARREFDAAALFELTAGIEWDPAGDGLGIAPPSRWDNCSGF
jgi:hypothetical protein